MLTPYIGAGRRAARRGPYRVTAIGAVRPRAEEPRRRRGHDGDDPEPERRVGSILRGTPAPSNHWRCSSAGPEREGHDSRNQMEATTTGS